MIDKNFWDSDTSRNEREALVEEAVLELEKIVKYVKAWGPRKVTIGKYTHSETGLKDELVLDKVLDLDAKTYTGGLVEECSKISYKKISQNSIKNMTLTQTHQITEPEYGAVIRKYKLNSHMLKNIFENLYLREEQQKIQRNRNSPPYSGKNFRVMFTSR